MSGILTCRTINHMPRYKAPSEYGGCGAMLLILGFLALCGGAITGFGDRMPNPPPDVIKEFEEWDRKRDIALAGGAILVFLGAGLVASSVSKGSIDLPNQKRD